MYIIEIQNILNELYTVKKSRDLFKQNKIAFMDQYKGIDTKTKTFINELKIEQIDFFANGLLAKRRRAVIDLMPYSYNHLKESFNKQFDTFAETFLPLGTHKHHEDGIAFCNYLLGSDIVLADKKIRDAVRWDRFKMLNFIDSKSFRMLHIKHLPHHDKKGNFVFANLKGKSKRVV